MDYDYELYDNELDENYYYGGEDEDETEIVQLTLWQVYHMCLKPTVYDSMKMVSHVFLWCFVYRLQTLKVSEQSRLNLYLINTSSLIYCALNIIKPTYKLRLFRKRFLKIFVSNSGPIVHIISILCGCLSLYSLFSTSFFYIIFLSLFCYTLLFILSYFQCQKNCGAILIVTSLSYLCFCELWLVDSKKWHRIRGPQMLIIMKSVSLAFDLDIGTVKSLPNLIYYLGYILCPGSAAFGPWISFNEYMYSYMEKWTFKSAQKISTSFMLAVLFLTISTCWSQYFIPHGSWKWFGAYRDALSFRTSHYFISYLSEVTLLLSGHSRANSKVVSKPFKVEFPRSIVNVVIYWNIPMHNWLKAYIFNTSKKFGNFFAILSTYTVSSLLHGLNFQLSAVLLSLGVYSYVEVMLRKKLSGGFSACILAKDCKADCSHRFKKYHPLVFLTNTFLVLVTIFHLAYLGVVFESDIQEEEEIGYSWRHSINKWASLNFLSPQIVLVTYIMYFLIK